MNSTFSKCVLIILGVAVWASLIVGLNFLAHNFNLRWDLTKYRQHTLREDTHQLLSSIKKEIKITAFYVGLPPKYLEDLLRQYEVHSNGWIKTEIVDPIAQIGYASEFGSFIRGQEKKAIVQSGNERKDVDFTDDDPLSEDLLNHALNQVSRTALNVYFIEGHGERSIQEDDEKGLNKFTQLLLANNIIPKKLFLETQGKVPEDCDLLVIAGPKQPLPIKDMAAIDDYLKNGGDALFLIENMPVTTPDKTLSAEELKENPTLNEILNNWGINIADDVVVDLESHVSGDVGCPATKNYLSHKAIVKDLDYTFYIRPRSISMLKDRRQTVKVAPLVLTTSTEKSWGETDRTLHVNFDSQLDRPGPVPIGFVIWESRKGIDQKSSDTKIIVFTDADFLSNAYLNIYSNAAMGLNAVKWLSDLDYPLVMNEESTKIEKLDLTSQQKKTVVIVLIVIPAIVLLAGLIRWRLS